MSPANASDLGTPTSAPVVTPAAIGHELDHEPEVVIDRLEELVSLYFEDQIADHEVTELEGLLFADEANLRRYIDHAQLHADLAEHFSPRSGEALETLVANLAASEG